MTKRDVDRTMNGLREMQHGRALSSTTPAGLPQAQLGPSAAAPPAELQPRALQQGVEDITALAQALKENNEELVETNEALVEDITALKEKNDELVEDVTALIIKNEDLESRILALEQIGGVGQ